MRLRIKVKAWLEVDGKDLPEPIFERVRDLPRMVRGETCKVTYDISVTEPVLRILYMLRDHYERKGIRLLG